MPHTSAGAQRGPRKSASISASRTSNLPAKTEVRIHVYDLLPPGRLSSFLWAVGGSLLHSGVVINGREYAYGGHNKRNVTGVYWTRPKFEPPGGTFRTDVLQGFTFRPQEEINAIIKEISDQFLGRNYNLLTNNCNHFTSALCERLTGRPAPAWLNRAASIGVALPCVVPREWVAPPDHDTADGELLDDDDDDDDDDQESDEGAAMLSSDRRREQREQEQRSQSASAKSKDSSAYSLAGGKKIAAEPQAPRLVSLSDAAGRELPPAERAPVPSKMMP